MSLDQYHHGVRVVEVNATQRDQQYQLTKARLQSEGILDLAHWL